MGVIEGDCRWCLLSVKIQSCFGRVGDVLHSLLGCSCPVLLITEVLLMQRGWSSGFFHFTFPQGTSLHTDSYLQKVGFC